MMICQDDFALIYGSDDRWHHLEECDDGNNQNDDGCSSKCTIEPGYGPDGVKISTVFLLQVHEEIEIKEFSVLYPVVDNHRWIYFQIVHCFTLRLSILLLL